MEESAITIRPAEASDAMAMSALVAEFAAQNLMLPRSEAQILHALGDFLVAVDVTKTPNGPLERVVGCGSLAALSPELAEVRSLAVDAGQQGNGLGGEIVRRLVDMARERGFAQVCALTLRPRFFERLGFEVVDRWSISPKVWQECIYCHKFHRCDEVAVLMTVSPPQSMHASLPARNGAAEHFVLTPR